MVGIQPLAYKNSKKFEDKKHAANNILVIEQEVKIAQALANNDINIRNRQMKKLRKWLQIRSESSYPFTDDDFLRIWKGLYYNMWMSDKPLVQEQLTEQISRLLNCFGDIEICIQFFGAFLKTMCYEWFGIDQWRIDKFMMLVRRMLRSMFSVMKKHSWHLECIEKFNERIEKILLNEDFSRLGLAMHFMDIFLEELAKVSEGNINATHVSSLILPFTRLMSTRYEPKLVTHCRTRIFHHLIYQSELGRDYSEKYDAWKEMGFPTKSINDLELMEQDSTFDDNDSKEADIPMKIQLDPRAGNVDVFMPELHFDAKLIVEEIEKLMRKPECTTKSRKALNQLLNTFKTYQNGVFPLGVKSMPRYEMKTEGPLLTEKIEALDNFENEMYGVGRKLKQLTKQKRRKLLKSINFNNTDEKNYDQVIEQAIPSECINDRKRNIQLAMMNNWIEEELDQDFGQQRSKKQKSANSKFSKIKENIKQGKTNTITSTTKQKNKGKEINKLKSVKVTPLIVDKNKIHSTNIQKILTNGTENVLNESNSALTSKWNEPLKEGEQEYFIPSRKMQIKSANSSLVLNPIAISQKLLLKDMKSSSVKDIAHSFSSPKTPLGGKRVKIALKNNTAQNPSEYLKQVQSSPDVPYDANKKPSKGLLKPNLMPSPINPFYKKKIGLQLLNETF